MPIAVLDASALIAFLRGEQGAEVVRSILEDEGTDLVAHVFNLCEVYKDFLGAEGEGTASTAIQDLLDLGIQPREDMDQKFWMDLAQFKKTFKVPWGDSFLIAMARRVGGEIVTADHKDFDAIATSFPQPVRFIR